MLSNVVSPFTPGTPVPLELFVGRAEELKHVLRRIHQATDGRPQVVFVEGERGIGKTSLAFVLRTLAQRKENVVGLHVMLSAAKSVEDVVALIFNKLAQESADKSWGERIREFLGSHIRTVGLFGVTFEFRAEPEDLTSIARRFPEEMMRLLGKFADEGSSGVLLVLDDINGLATSEEFANWLKSVVDEMATSGRSCPLCLLIVGLEERRRQLISCQPSLARVFDVVNIQALSYAEMQDFFRKALGEIDVEVDTNALHVLVHHAGGLPVLAHEIGESLISTADSHLVSVEDAVRAVIRAARVIGAKYIRPQVESAIASQNYRSILKKVGKVLNEEFTRAEVRAQLCGSERKVFDNFLRRMEKLEVIVRREGRGMYRFARRLDYLYLCIQAMGEQSG